MQRTPVDSSNLSSVGYGNSTLEIEFHSGKVYRYLHVPEMVYSALMFAPSKGNYFYTYIKDKYPYQPLN
ncbi:KTSC domain-containing protein [Clostridium botulinum]|uniref:KTSC domain containing protein n=1 Tax=Clostridium botulinum B2 450 TaxID=1379739 RepID=A0A0D1BTI7_CLOBO|nr:KTSC domain-containing protein [Clostridium botulinum]KIS22061.1 KTSC domain containing protein [Clostridium botulinum B2 450]